MFRKQIEDVLTVTLKYFFDIDYTLFNNSFLVVPVLIAGFFRVAYLELRYEVACGVQTVRRDMFAIRKDIRKARKWCMEQSMYTVIAGNFRSFKETLDKSSINWQ